MQRYLVGIAGGSGSGKSELAVTLCREFPKKFALVHVDDYFKKPEDAPQTPLDGPNWDHPGAVRFGDLHRNLSSLLGGRPVTVNTKSELYHLDYKPELKNRILYTIQPKPVILLEGYLALYEREIRRMMDLRIYLDMPIEESLRRRSANKSVKDERYLQEVLIPAHKQFVEPTKIHANLILDVSIRTKFDVLRDVSGVLRFKNLI